MLLRAPRLCFILVHRYQCCFLVDIEEVFFVRVVVRAIHLAFYVTDNLFMEFLKSHDLNRPTR